MESGMTIHEWDEAMGRWRNPSSPEWVVYTPHVDPHTNCWASTIFNEKTGEHYLFSRRYNEDSIPEINHDAHSILEEYFNENPEVLPWYKAVKGEIWELVLNEGGESYVSVVCLAVSDRHFLPLDNTFLYNLHGDKRSFREFRDMKEEIEIIKFSSGQIISGKIVWSQNSVNNEETSDYNVSTNIEEKENNQQKNSDNSYSLTDDIYDDQDYAVITDKNSPGYFLK